MRLRSLFSRSINLVILVVLLLFSVPTPAFGWAATTRSPGNFPTHQHILRNAYQLLEADPAYAQSRFPTLEAILEHEGMKWQTNFTFDLVGSNPYDIVGAGPDDEAKTRYSDHYYNPVTGQGNGPNAARDYFLKLCQAMYLPDNDNEVSAGQGAAWSAHFLADMYVPYHVVGMPGSDARARDNSGNYLLDDTITGPDLLYGQPDDRDLPGGGWGSGENFAKAIRRYVKYYNDMGPQANRDWMDPWYLNGWWLGDMKFLYSSHVSWEKYANGQYEAHPYSGIEATEAPGWVNGLNTWDTTFAGQGDLVTAYTVSAANVTRNGIEKYWEKPEEGVYTAIESVYTLWRASISAMKPQIEIIPNADGSCQVKGAVYNAADEDVRDVEMKITVSGGELQGENQQQVAFIEKGDWARHTWQVATDAPDQLQVKLEVIGRYERTPDLQYAVAETVKPLTVTISPDKINRGDTVTLSVRIEPPQQTALSIIEWGPLEEVTGYFQTAANGLFNEEFKVKEEDYEAYDGWHTVIVEATEYDLKGSVRFYIGERPDIDILDCNELQAKLSLRTRWVQPDGTEVPSLFNVGGGGGTGGFVMGTFTGTSFKADWDETVETSKGSLLPSTREWGNISVDFSSDYSRITGFNLEYNCEALDTERVDPVRISTTISAADIPEWDRRIDYRGKGVIMYRIEDYEVCDPGHSLVLKSQRTNRDGTIDTLADYNCEPTAGISILHFEFREPGD